MRIITKLVLLVSCILVITVPTSAIINVTAEDVGTTWITWSWDEGLNVTDIFVDGYKMCGYESTMPSFDMLNQAPCQFHNVSVFTDTDNGTNETYTSCGNDTYIMSIDEGTESTGIAVAVLGITIGGIIIYKRKRDGEEDDMT